MKHLIIAKFLDLLTSFYGQANHTINDKSFEGEKFCGLLGSSGTYVKKSFAIFSITTFIHS